MRNTRIGFCIFVFIVANIVLLGSYNNETGGHGTDTPIAKKTVTRPFLDDIGFCWQEAQVNRLMKYLAEHDSETSNTGEAVPVAGIAPHDDYLYSGTVSYPLFRQIKCKEVVIFGVTHRTVRNRIGDPQGKLIFDEYENWYGPFGNVPVSGLREFLKERLNKESFLVSNEAHRYEHSIESMIPYLQYFNRDVRITPIMVTGMDFTEMERLTKSLAVQIVAYIQENRLTLGKDIFVLMSADANHYGKAFQNTVFGENARAHDLATAYDKKIADDCLSGEITDEKIKALTGHLWGKTYKDYKDTVWCGKFSIPFGLMTVLHMRAKLCGKQPSKPLKGKVLRFSDTYSEGVLPLKKPGFGITAPFSLKHWVGFLSAVYY